VDDEEEEVLLVDTWLNGAHFVCAREGEYYGNTPVYARVGFLVV